MGTELFVERRGTGPDLVLVHGWGLHGGVWTPLLEALIPRFRLHLVDLPGHGRSPASGSFELAAVAKAVSAAVPAGARWLGWSLGGQIALQAAVDGAVVRLALVATNPRFVQARDWPHAMAPETLAAFARDLADDYRGTLERFLALQAMGAPGAKATIRQLREQVFAYGEPDRAALAGGLELLRRVDLRPQLPRLSLPVLWIGGARDRLVPPAAVRAAAAASGGRAVEIAAAGHAPFVSHAQSVAAELLEFFRD